MTKTMKSCRVCRVTPFKGNHKIVNISLIGGGLHTLHKIFHSSLTGNGLGVVGA